MNTPAFKAGMLVYICTVSQPVRKAHTAFDAGLCDLSDCGLRLNAYANAHDTATA